MAGGHGDWWQMWDAIISDFLEKERSEVKTKTASKAPRKSSKCWQSLGLGYITSTHRATDRCPKCGYNMGRTWRKRNPR